MSSVISVDGRKYIAVETDNIPVVGSKSWETFLNCDYPVGCIHRETVTTDDGKTAYRCVFVGTTDSEIVTIRYFIKKGSVRE